MINKYRIVRILNNNVILAANLINSNEAVLVGRGIGFGRKNGDISSILPNEIEKIFITYDEKLKRDYIDLVNQMDESILSMCTDIILMAEKLLGPLNSRLHIVLTDHIGFALERINNGMEIHNPFLHEIKSLYPDEYKVALIAQEYIKNVTGINIVEDEVGFIALHLNAGKQHKDVKDTMRNTRLIKELIEVIEKNLHYKIENDLTYSRLIHHLRGTIERVEKNQTVKNPLLDMLKKEFNDSFRIAITMKEKIESCINLIVPDDELGYMTIHIDRIRRMSKQNMK